MVWDETVPKATKGDRKNKKYSVWSRGRTTPHT